MTTIVIVALVIVILSVVVAWILGPSIPDTRVHDRTLDRYHRSRDRSNEEPRAHRRLP